MRIVVIGAGGRTGRLVVEHLIGAGHQVVATIRSPKHMADMVRLGAETVMLDLDLSTGPDFQAVFKGADAIVFAAGSAAGESSALDRTGTVKTVRAAASAGVTRYLTISSIGASTGLKLSGEMNNDEMRDYYRQKRAANKHLRESGLDYTIVEPGELTDGKPTGKIVISEAAIDFAAIDRADVAAVVTALIASRRSIGKVYQLTGGKTSIATAVANVLGEDVVPVKLPAAKAPAKKAVAKKAPAAKAPAKKAAAKAPAKKAPAKKAPAKKAPAKKK